MAQTNAGKATGDPWARKRRRESTNNTEHKSKSEPRLSRRATQVAVEVPLGQRDTGHRPQKSGKLEAQIARKERRPPEVGIEKGKKVWLLELFSNLWGSFSFVSPKFRCSSVPLFRCSALKPFFCFRICCDSLFGLRLSQSPLPGSIVTVAFPSSSSLPLLVCFLVSATPGRVVSGPRVEGRRSPREGLPGGSSGLNGDLPFRSESRNGDRVPVESAQNCSGPLLSSARKKTEAKADAAEVGQREALGLISDCQRKPERPPN